MEETDETVEVVQRVAALDIGKATLMACIRTSSPGQAGWPTGCASWR